MNFSFGIPLPKKNYSYLKLAQLLSIVFFSVGCEGIAAATVLGKDICLLHCKFLGDTEIWVKTTSKLSSEITMRECVSFLQKSQ